MANLNVELLSIYWIVPWIEVARKGGNGESKGMGQQSRRKCLGKPKGEVTRPKPAHESDVRKAPAER